MSKTPKKVALEDATIVQLRAFCVAALGHSPKPTDEAPALRALIKQAGFDKEIVDHGDPLIDSDAPRQGNRLDAPPADENQDERLNRKVRINIATGTDKGEDEPLPVGVNGVVMLIPRGVDVDVPFKYYEALMRAEQLLYDPNGEKGLSKPRRVPLYQVSMFGFSDQYADRAA